MNIAAGTPVVTLPGAAGTILGATAEEHIAELKKKEAWLYRRSRAFLSVDR